MSEARQTKGAGGGRRAFKFAVGLAAAAGVLAYALHAARGGQLQYRFGAVTLRTGDYLWNWPLSPRTLLGWLGGAALLALAAWPARRGRAEVVAAPVRSFILGWAALTAAGALVLMQAMGFPALDPLMLLVVGVLGALAAWGLRGRGPDAPAARLAGWMTHAGAGRAFPWVAALAGAGVMVASWRLVYHGQPLVTDSQSQIAQALLLLQGHWRLEIAQGLRDMICFPYALQTVPSYSQYPPGYILPLVPVLWAGLPAQALDVAAAALTAGLTTLLARRVAGPAAAVAAALLLLGSPFFMCLSGSAMNHSFAAALLLAAALCFIPAGPPRAARGRLAFLGGLCLGWAAMTRPVTGLGHGMVWAGVWAALLAAAVFRERRGGVVRSDRAPGALVRQLLWAAAGAVLPVALFLYYNSRTTGHPFVMGYQVSNPALHRLGFHEGEMPFTPAQALHRVAANFLSLNFALFGWAVGSWTLVAAWWLRTRLTRGERVLLALVTVQTGLYAIYQFHDLFLGPRFLYESLPAWIVLGAAGLATLLRRRSWGSGLLWIVLILLTLGGAMEGKRFWEDKFARSIAQHQALDRFMRARLPFREPTVVVLPGKEEGEMIGRYFAPGRVWFVTRQNEAAARARPELKDYRWIEYQ